MGIIENWLVICQSTDLILESCYIYRHHTLISFGWFGLEAPSIWSWQKIRVFRPPISTRHVSLAHQSTIGRKHPITPNLWKKKKKEQKNLSYLGPQLAETPSPFPITTSPTQPVTTATTIAVATNGLADGVGVDLGWRWVIPSSSLVGQWLVTTRIEGLAQRPPLVAGGGQAATPKAWGGNRTNLRSIYEWPESYPQTLRVAVRPSGSHPKFLLEAVAVAAAAAASRLGWVFFFFWKKTKRVRGKV